MTKKTPVLGYSHTLKALRSRILYGSALACVALALIVGDRLRFDREEQPVAINLGDFVNIPAHKRHRVEWTTPDEPMIWPAVHYGDQQ
jgi:cupin 2 domain-containing protein